MRLNLALPETVPTGEPVPITLQLQNTSSGPVEVYLTGRPVAFDIVVARAGGEIVWRRLEGATIPMVLQLQQLAAGELLEFGEIWDQRTNRGQPVGTGIYTVQGLLGTGGPRSLKTARALLHLIP